MTAADLAMLGVLVLGGAASLLVVTSRNVVHSALYLVVALLSVGGAFLALGAEFLAWAQVLVYVGAVVVLILFGLMLTRAPIGPMAQGNELGRALPIGVSVGLFGFLVAMIVQAFGDVRLDLAPVLTADIGAVLYVHWAFPFMVVGFLLTAALIGAVIIARREEGEGPPTIASAEPELERTPSDATADPSPALQGRR